MVTSGESFILLEKNFLKISMRQREKVMDTNIDFSKNLKLKTTLHLLITLKQKKIKQSLKHQLLFLIHLLMIHRNQLLLLMLQYLGI